MIQNREKALLHCYARLARLQEQEYRALLKRSAGVPSAADPDFDQPGFERAMAALETILWDRADRRVLSAPRGFSRYYWRNRLPAAGRINSRQYRLIMQVWTQLGEWMPDAQRTPEYFSGIVAKATGRPDVGAFALTSHQAWQLIEALKSRLQDSIRKATLESAAIGP
jgi:hypothetical protein